MFSKMVKACSSFSRSDPQTSNRSLQITFWQYISFLKCLVFVVQILDFL